MGDSEEGGRMEVSLGVRLMPKGSRSESGVIGSTLPGPTQGERRRSPSATVQLDDVSSMVGSPVTRSRGSRGVVSLEGVVTVGVVGAEVPLGNHWEEIFLLQNHPLQQIFFLRFRFSSTHSREQPHL